jgi:hypothetical protein
MNKLRAEILEEAKQTICQDRNDQYGEPEDNFAKIAALWSTYLGVDLKPSDIAMMMTLFKIARHKTGGAKRDTFVDICGYAACAAECCLE